MIGPYDFRDHGIVDRISEWASASFNAGHNGIDHYFTKIPFLEKLEQLSGEIWQTQSFQNMEMGKTKFAALKRKRKQLFCFIRAKCKRR